MSRWPPVQAPARTDRAVELTTLWALLLLEVALGLVGCILLSLAAGESRDSEDATRFAAGGAFLFTIAALAAALGVRRWRRWSWTLAAVLQLVLAIGAGIAMLSAGQTGATAVYLVAFALAAATMLVLSTSRVRRELGQG